MSLPHRSCLTSPRVKPALFFFFCLTSSFHHAIPTQAFTESATIAAYPCYSFDDFHQATTLGSAFYGLYFVVSYPLFFTLDEPPEALAASAPKGRKSTSAVPANGGGTTNGKPNDDVHFVPHSLRSTILEALGAGMLVLMLLDAVRVWLHLDLNVALERPCKRDASQTCAPFTGQFC